MASRFSVEGVFSAVDRFTGPIRRMTDRVSRFAGRAERELGKVTRVTDGIARGVGRAGAAAVAAGAVVGAALADIIRTGASFEKTMMSAVAKFPGEIQRGTEAFENLRKAAEEVGATTEFDAQQAAGALDVYAAAGFSAEQAIASLAGAGDLATVSGLTLDAAASVAADSLSALGLSSEDAATQAANLTRVNDVLAKTSSMVNTSVTDMAEAIKAGGNITVQSGQSVETFGALVAGMAEANIKGAEAGTAIRNVLLRLQAPAAKGAKAMARLGIDIRDGDGNMRDMVDVIGELSKSMEGMGTAEKTRALSEIFGAETIGPALALLQSGSEGLAKFRDSLNGAGGAAGQMAATMRDTTTGDIDGFTSAIDGVKTAIFGVISGPFRELLAGLTEWTNKNRDVITSGIKEFLDWFSGALPEIVKWGRRIAVVVGVFLSVAAALKIASTAAAIFNAVMALNPMVALAIAIVAAVALIIAFWPEISAFFASLWDDIKAITASVGEWFSEAWQTVSDVAISAFESIASFFISIWDTVKSALVAAFEFIVGVLTIVYGPIFEQLQPVFDWLVEIGTMLMEKWGIVRDFLAGIWQAVSGKASEAWGGIKETAVGVADTIVGSFSAAWDAVSAKAEEVFAMVKEVWAPISDFFSGLWDGIVAVFTEKFGAIADAVGSVVGAIRSVGRDTLGTNDEGDGTSGMRAPNVVSPQERTARTISETTNTTRGEVTIRDESGRAEVTRQPRGPVAVRVQATGAY